MHAPDRLRRAYVEEPAFLRTVRDLVEHESPTGDLEAANALADHLTHLLTRDGWSTERIARDEVGDVVRATLPGNDPSDATLILAHYDTVWPVGTLRDPMPWRHENDVLHGPGVLDMKAGIAAAVHAARLARSEGPLRGPVTLLITSDEEQGSVHSRELLEEEARRHARVLVVEMSRDDGALKVGRKGVGVLHAAFRGVSAHAGNDPHAGASALRELARFLLFAEGLAEPPSDDGLGTTVAVTVAHGGTVGNVIPEHAACEIDLRVLRAEEGDRVVNALHAYRPHDPRIDVHVTGGMNRPPMERTEANRTLATEAHAHLRAMDLRLSEAVVGGGSDGNFTSALGVATLDGLGAVGSGPHARHEHVRVRETLQRIALLAALLRRPA
ncbi:MAG: M20 family metallopeptidase [Trueperaceae bacterium]